MKLIAICGPKGSGKSSLAMHLVREYDYERMSFADPLKFMLATLLQYQDVPETIIWRMLYGDLKEKPTPFLEGRTPRYAMQTIGTEWRDMISKDLYINVFKRHLAIADVENKSIVVDDLRFTLSAPEELTIRELGGYIIRLSRSRNDADHADTHISEQEYKKISPDQVIFNNHETVEEFIKHCNAVLPLALRSKNG